MEAERGFGEDSSTVSQQGNLVGELLAEVRILKTRLAAGQLSVGLEPLELVLQAQLPQS